MYQLSTVVVDGGATRWSTSGERLGWGRFWTVLLYLLFRGLRVYDIICIYTSVSPSGYVACYQVVYEDKVLQSAAHGITRPASRAST